MNQPGSVNARSLLSAQSEVGGPAPYTKLRLPGNFPRPGFNPKETTPIYDQLASEGFRPPDAFERVGRDFSRLAQRVGTPFAHIAMTLPSRLKQPPNVRARYRRLLAEAWEDQLLPPEALRHYQRMAYGP